MFTAPSNVPWLVGKHNNYKLKCFIYLMDLFHQCVKESVKCLQLYVFFFLPRQLIQNPEAEIYSSPGAEVTCPWLLPLKKLPPMRLPFTGLWPRGLQLGTTRPSAGLSQLPKIVPHYTPQGLAGSAAASRKLHRVKGLWLYCEQWPKALWCTGI